MRHFPPRRPPAPGPRRVHQASASTRLVAPSGRAHALAPGHSAAIAAVAVAAVAAAADEQLRPAAPAQVQAPGRLRLMVLRDVLWHGAPARGAEALPTRT